jgi:predicted TIM-barrel fold metal-dependent hydrolase
MIREIPVIDMQHHYIPAEALQFVGKTDEYDYSIGLKRYGKAYEVMQNVDLHLSFMDASGIDMAILSTGSFTPNGYKFCQTCNTGYGKVVKAHPDRFRGMIHVYPKDDEGMNVNEIKRGVEELGLWGLALASSYREITADSAAMDHLYETAVHYDMPVFIHPSIRVNLWGGERYDLYTTLSREYDIAKSFVEIVYGVISRFPALKVIMAHFGGGLPSLKGRLLAWHQPQGVPLPEGERGHGRSIDEAKELGLFDDFERLTEGMLFDSAGYGGWLPVMASAYKTLGSDHICFGTDYPYELNKPLYTRKILDDIGGLNVTDEEKKKFLFGNLKRLFRLGKWPTHAV